MSQELLWELQRCISRERVVLRATAEPAIQRAASGTSSASPGQFYRHRSQHRLRKLDSGARECSQLRYELCCSLGNEPAGIAVQRGIYCIETVSQKLAGGREPSCEGGLPDKVSKSAPRYPGSSGYQSKTFCLQRSQQRSQICCCWLRGCTGSWTTSFAPLFYQISDMLPPPRRIAVRL